MSTPHLILIHSTFRHTRHAAPWLQRILPAALVARLDWTSLRLVSERTHGRRLRVGFADLVFEIFALGSRHRVLIAVEHRSYDDVWLQHTLIRYSVHLVHGSRRDRKAPPTSVVAVVLYHGPTRLELHQAPLDDLDPATAELLATLQPHLRVIGDDLTACTEEQLMGRGLTPLGTLTHLCVRVLPGLDASSALAAIDRWSGLLRDVDADEDPQNADEAFEPICWYLLHVTKAPAEDVHMAFQKHLRRTEGFTMSTAERLRREGLAEGRVEGRVEGLAEGRVKTLLLQLDRRFGPLSPSVEARVRTASTAELDRWTLTILDATTLESVFADG